MSVKALVLPLGRRAICDSYHGVTCAVRQYDFEADFRRPALPEGQGFVCSGAQDPVLQCLYSHGFHGYGSVPHSAVSVEQLESLGLDQLAALAQVCLPAKAGLHAACVGLPALQCNVHAPDPIWPTQT